MTRPGGTMFLVRDGKVFYASERKEDGKASLVHIEEFDKLYAPPIMASRLMCANGLFCSWREFWHPVAIFNPSTRQVRFLPPPKDQVVHSLCFFLFGFEPEENKYKVVLTSSHDQQEYKRHLVFTLGIDESWREIKSTITFTPYKDGICVNGVIYQFTYKSGWNITAFDVKAESFRMIQLWNDYLQHKVHLYNLIQVNGKLAVIDYGEDFGGGDMDLWILGETTQEGWARHIIPFPSQWKPRLVEKPISCFCTHREGEIVFAARMNETFEFSYLCYHVTRRIWREFEMKGLPIEGPIRGIYTYEASRFPL